MICTALIPYKGKKAYILLHISNAHILAFLSTGTHMYDALFKSMNERKRHRKETNQRISDSVATAQEQVAAVLIESFPKKQCVAGTVKVALGAQVILRTHARLIPRQMSIDAVLSKPVTHVDLWDANNARLTTAIAEIYVPCREPTRSFGRHTQIP